MGLVQRKGIWQWRKMVDGVMLNRSTKTDDKALATKLARKWEHEAIQQIKVLGERPVTLHDAIEGFLAVRKHSRGYGVAVVQMRHWKALIPDGLRFPRQTGHPFHGKLDIRSSANWTPIPLQTGQFEAA